jgi:hypothetical protein
VEAEQPSNAKPKLAAGFLFSQLTKKNTVL